MDTNTANSAVLLISIPGFTVVREDVPVSDATGIITNDTANNATHTPRFHITWENRNVPLEDIKRVGNVVNNSTDYGEISRRMINALRTRTSLTQHQIMSARSALLKNKIMCGYSRMNMLVSRIIPEYESEGIMAISVRYDFPPLSLMRGILIRKNYAQASLHKIFVKKLNAADILSKYDMQQYMIAESKDAESIFNQHAIAVVAAANELVFVNYFRSLGIKLSDEKEIAAEQIASHGRAIATPDILFHDEVWINGERVAWLDYKDYIGTNVRFLYTSNVKQAHEYEIRWGRGAICYHHGFIAGMQIPGAMLLDAYVLPIKLQNKDVPGSIHHVRPQAASSKTSTRQGVTQIKKI